MANRTEPTRWQRSAKIVWEQLEGEALLIQPESGQRWTLNRAGALIWSLCDGSRSLPQLARALATATGRRVSQVQSEIDLLCRRLAEMNLLTASTGPQPVGSGISSSAFRMAGVSGTPAFTQLSLGAGPRHRPSPRGNSIPG